MTDATLVLVVLTIGVYALKAAAPLAMGGKPLPDLLARIADLLPAAMLAALVVTSAVADGRALTIDARLVGLATAAVALRFKAPFVVVVVLAAAATALTRAVAG